MSLDSLTRWACPTHNDQFSQSAQFAKYNSNTSDWMQMLMLWDFAQWERFHAHFASSDAMEQQCVYVLFCADEEPDAALLEEDVAALVDILDRDFTTTGTAAPAKKATRKRAEHEVRYLRSQVEDYTRQLALLQDVNPTKRPSEWKMRSKRQASERMAAEEENEVLRNMLEQNKRMAESLMKIVSKRPKLANSTYLEDWRANKLAADPAQRRAGFHAIVDAKYAQLEHVFIQHGLIDKEETVGLQTNVSYDERLDDIVFEAVLVEGGDLPYRACADLLWLAYGVPTESETESNAVMETFGPDAMQLKVSTQFKKYNVTVHERIACKRYTEPNRVVMVFSSILEDELYPYPNGVYVSRETSWLVVSPDGDAHFKVQYFASGSLPCKSSHDGFQFSDDDIRTMAFAEHIMANYRRMADLFKAYLMELVAADDNVGLPPPTI
ncbi:Aste57867_24984 [Aphanomyces stellatus]|uniref:Aste57867_24984 protein n=1 Tax=Aphanomyces stellatus TaxID=120398 RepID=A0A485LRW9_9STRA|nr:hypothetical protein As57867_024906 [Aphanomyces stellatus]VFU01615.1 Aste57867_24984 [Aphanomyces stellatus]